MFAEREACVSRGGCLQPGLERLERGVDLLHREAVARGVESLEPLPGDVDDHPLGRLDVATFGELCEGRDRDAARRLREDAGRLGEEADAVADLVETTG